MKWHHGVLQRVHDCTKEDVCTASIVVVRRKRSWNAEVVVVVDDTIILVGVLLASFVMHHLLLLLLLLFHYQCTVVGWFAASFCLFRVLLLLKLNKSSFFLYIFRFIFIAKVSEEIARVGFLECWKNTRHFGKKRMNKGLFQTKTLCPKMFILCILQFYY